MRSLFENMDQLKRSINVLLLIIVIIVLIDIGVYFAVSQQILKPLLVPTPNPIACTQEAKQCSDGSYVSRTGPNCEFAQCPISNPNPTPNPNPKPTPILPPDTGQCDVKPDAQGNCPAGCVNYGNPLGCVTQEYYDYCWSGPQNQNCPVCLAENSLIDTPIGVIAVQNLQQGMAVWTVDKSGNKISATIIKTSKTPVPSTHQIVHLVLGDGRELFVSPGHPTIDGRTIGDLASGDLYDGVSIISTERVPYGESATYDVLPSGDTGFYWANCILIGSTLR